MADLGSMWDRWSGTLDTAVDGILGDTIAFADDGMTFVDVQGFVITVEGRPGGLDEYDSALGSRNRVKMSRAIIGEPHPRQRLMHAKLGEGRFQPGGDAPDEDGRYYIFDVQKAES